jgi:hypothetical protein
MHAPLKPEKVDPPVAVADKVTIVPSLKLAAQVVGQSIPAGLLVTLPLPETETVNCAGLTAVNVAETDWLPESRIVHTEPLHAPPKPAKLNPEAAVAVNVTDVPEAKLALQVEGQLTPAGLLITVPVPVTETVNCACCRGGGGVMEPPPQAVNPNNRRRIAGQSGNPPRTKHTSLRALLAARVAPLGANVSSWVVLWLSG